MYGFGCFLFKSDTYPVVDSGATGAWLRGPLVWLQSLTAVGRPVAPALLTAAILGSFTLASSYLDRDLKPVYTHIHLVLRPHEKHTFTGPNYRAYFIIYAPDYR